MRERSENFLHYVILTAFPILHLCRASERRDSALKSELETQGQACSPIQGDYKLCLCAELLQHPPQSPEGHDLLFAFFVIASPLPT